ncbi:MAG: PRC-barrel domain-containing protein [Hyphomicrobiaceae bacterium]
MDQKLEPAVAVLTAGANSNGLQPHPLNPAVATQFVTEQPANERLARVFLGADVQNAAGERVGDINDFLFDATGRITTVVLGVGGFLGMGEKTVGIPFNACTYGVDKDGARIIAIELGKNALMQAPAFHATEKTILDTVKDKAADLGHRTADKAAELKDHAARKILDLTKSTPGKS